MAEIAALESNDSAVGVNMKKNTILIVICVILACVIAFFQAKTMITIKFHLSGTDYAREFFKTGVWSGLSLAADFYFLAFLLRKKKVIRILLIYFGTCGVLAGGYSLIMGIVKGLF